MYIQRCFGTILTVIGRILYCKGSVPGLSTVVPIFTEMIPSYYSLFLIALTSRVHHRKLGLQFSLDS